MAHQPMHVGEHAETVGDFLNDLARMPRRCRRLDNRMTQMPMKVDADRTQEWRSWRCR